MHRQQFILVNLKKPFSNLGKNLSRVLTKNDREQRFRSSSATTANQVSSATPSSSLGSERLLRPNLSDGFENKGVMNLEDMRKQIAPWIPIGQMQQGLLSHLSTSDILRALVVLRLCSYDFVVDKSLNLFNLSQKFGPVGNWILRKTFFNQFVGGDNIPMMTTVVNSLHKRGLTLMVAPVLEEDVEDAKSSKNKYDDNLNSLLELAQMTSSLDKQKPILQLKMSAVAPANTLENISKAIIEKCKSNNGHPTAKMVTDIANSIERPESLNLKVEKSDMAHFLDGLTRANTLVKAARDKNIVITVDAEFYSCKAAISSVALALITRYNKTDFVVGNTIQAYLKDAVATIQSELEVVGREIGVNWCGKIVRGAYMDRERFLAQKNGYSSPICDNYDDTSLSYNRAVRQVLEFMANKSSSSSLGNHDHLMVASHNEKSIRLAAQLMKELGINKESDFVSFGQIYGMGDYLSTPLVQGGYKVYKSTPYGPILSVMPYLARRASENRSVMKGAREERLMLRRELKSRLGF